MTFLEPKFYSDGIVYVQCPSVEGFDLEFFRQYKPFLYGGGSFPRSLSVRPLKLCTSLLNYRVQMTGLHRGYCSQMLS